MTSDFAPTRDAALSWPFIERSSARSGVTFTASRCLARPAGCRSTRGPTASETPRARAYKQAAVAVMRATSAAEGRPAGRSPRNWNLARRPRGVRQTSPRTSGSTSAQRRAQRRRRRDLGHKARVPVTAPDLDDPLPRLPGAVQRPERRIYSAAGLPLVPGHRAGHEGLQRPGQRHAALAADVGHVAVRRPAAGSSGLAGHRPCRRRPRPGGVAGVERVCVRGGWRSVAAHRSLLRGAAALRARRASAPAGSTSPTSTAAGSSATVAQRRSRWPPLPLSANGRSAPAGGRRTCRA